MNTLPVKVMTVIFVRQGSRILLGMKKKGLGAGRWNGFGGKVEEGETIEEAARREIQEEAGLEVGAVVEAGFCEFHSPVRPFVVHMHVFIADTFSGEPTESDEMRPEWFEVSALPEGEMWPSDLLWWPYLLRGDKFKARFVFDKDDQVLEHGI